MLEWQDQSAMPEEWIETIRLILDELAQARERHKDGVIEVLLKDGKPVTVRATGARPIKISPKLDVE